MDLWESIARTVMALAVVLALMGLVAWVAKRLLGGWGRLAGPAPLVHVVASGYLAPRKSIALVSVAGEYLIVGLTADQMVPLGRFDDPQKLHAALTAVEQPGAAVGSAAERPAEWITQILDRFRPMTQRRQEE